MLITFEIVHSYVSKCNSNAFEELSGSYKCFTFSSHTFLLHLWLLMYSLFGRHICSFSCMLMTLTLYTICISTCSTNTYEILSDSHIYFTFGIHVCSFTSMINDVFLLWLTHLFFFSHLCQYHVNLFIMLMPMKCPVSQIYFTFGIFQLNYCLPQIVTYFALVTLKTI